jgi:hypothetical protein
VKIFPKKHFTWREPKAFLTVLDKHERMSRRWWHRPLLFLVVGACILLRWWAAPRDPGKAPPSFETALVLAVAAGAVLVYFLPWLTTKLPSKITVFDHGILRSRGQDQVTRFADVTSFAWRTAPDFSTLILTHRRGREIFVGVPLDISHDALTAFLSERISNPIP